MVLEEDTQDEVGAKKKIEEEINQLADLKAKFKMKDKDEKLDFFLSAVECLAESIDEMNEVAKQKATTDQSLNKSLDATLAKLDDYLLSGQTIEKAILQLAKREGNDANTALLIRETTRQTQELTAAISKILDKPTSTGEGQIKEMLALIERTNKTVLTSLATYTSQMEKTVQILAQAIANRPTTWKHEIKRQNGFINHVISTVGQ